METDLTAASRALVNDALLAEKYRDHLLYGEWSGFRDCHVEPDFVIHEKPDTDTLRLVRLDRTANSDGERII